MSLAALAAVNGAAAAEPAKAVVSLTEAIESRRLEPEALAKALIDRALAYQARSQYQQAIDDYSAALRVDAMTTRKRAIILYNRGLAYQKLNSQAMAIEDFTSALFLDPSFAEAFHGRANALRLSGQYLFALADYEKARRNNHPAPYLLYFGESLTYEALRRPDDARRAAAEALALKPDFAAARDKLAELGGSGQSTVTVNRTEPAQEPAFRPIVSGNHPIVTGAIAGPDLTVSKIEQPEAVPPGAELMGEDETAQAGMEAAPELPPAVEPPPVKAAPTAKPQVAAKPPTVKQAAIVKADPGKADDAKADAKALAVKTPTGWVVQLSSQRDESTAWSSWKKLKASAGGVLADQSPAVVRADLGAKGVYFRLQLQGLESRRDAVELCGKLKARGASCLVMNAGV